MILHLEHTHKKLPGVFVFLHNILHALHHPRLTRPVKVKCVIHNRGVQAETDVETIQFLRLKLDTNLLTKYAPATNRAITGYSLSMEKWQIHKKLSCNTEETITFFDKNLIKSSTLKASMVTASCSDILWTFSGPRTSLILWSYNKKRLFCLVVFLSICIVAVHS